MGRLSRRLPRSRSRNRPPGGDTAGDERFESRAAGAAPERGPGHQARHETRALSREAIARSADLQRRYAAEYVSMLSVIGDREVAREAARVNLSAMLAGQSRIVPVEGRFAADRFADAIARSGENLDAIRRAVSRFVERAVPAIEAPVRVPHPERER
jgi:hypothetical protein